MIVMLRKAISMSEKLANDFGLNRGTVLNPGVPKNVRKLSR